MTKQEIKQKIYTGNLVQCKSDEYKTNVRRYLQEVAGEFIDANDVLRASIALNEVKRLDTKFSFESSLN